MSDDGYTLVETLGALMITGLAIGGLTAGVQVMSEQQRRLGLGLRETTAERRVQASFDRLLDGQGPFRSHEPQRFTGGPAAFDFECGADAPCAARLASEDAKLVLHLDAGSGDVGLPLQRSGTAQFRYEGSLGVSDVWPPAMPERQALRSITVVGPDGAVLAQARVWREQPADCAFDPVMQDCR
jgi:hypothetical protein